MLSGACVACGGSAVFGEGDHFGEDGFALGVGDGHGAGVLVLRLEGKRGATAMDLLVNDLLDGIRLGGVRADGVVAAAAEDAGVAEEI